MANLRISLATASVVVIRYLCPVQPSPSLARTLVLLSTSGISSAVERCLLAATQQRQSPVNSTLFGLLTFVLDGVKLFSKILSPSTTSILALYAAGVAFVIAVVADGRLSLTLLPDLFAPQLFAWVALGILEALSLASFATVQNSYVTLALLRAVELAIVFEVVWALLELVLFAWHDVLKSGLLIRIDFSVLGLGLFPLWMAVFEKVPFDIVEAESELIDGATVEFEGHVFSSLYAAEVLLGLLGLKLFVVSSGFLALPLMALVLLAFVGRIALARYLFADLLETLLAAGLALSLPWLVFALWPGLEPSGAL